MANIAKRNFFFLLVIVLICSGVFLYKTKVDKDNMVLVSTLASLQKGINERQDSVEKLKIQYNSQISKIKSEQTEIEKSIKTLEEENIKIKSEKTKNIRKKKENDEKINNNLKLIEAKKKDVQNKNDQISSKNQILDIIQGLENTIMTWKQSAFDILKKCQNGKITNEVKDEIMRVTDDIKNVNNKYDEDIVKINNDLADKGKDKDKQK